MSKYKVLLTDTCFPDTSIEEKVLKEADAELILSPSTKAEDLIREGRDCDGVIFDFAPMTENVLSHLKKCRVASRVGIGYDNIDLKAAARHGIMVANVPDYCLDEVSDHAIALALACQRRIVQYNSRVHDGNWEVKGAGPIHRVRGENFCLYGFGKIAQLEAEKVKGFGFRVYTYDPYVSDAVLEKHGVCRVSSLEELAEIADIFSIQLLLNKETQESVNQEILSRMKDDVILINTSRGGIVSEPDLVEALKEKTAMQAGLDVMSSEPLPDSSELYQLPNVILTPHVAFYTEESENELRRRSAEEVVFALEEGRPHSFLNQKEFLKAANGGV